MASPWQKKKLIHRISPPTWALTTTTDHGEWYFWTPLHRQSCQLSLKEHKVRHNYRSIIIYTPMVRWLNKVSWIKRKLLINAAKPGTTNNFLDLHAPLSTFCIGVGNSARAPSIQSTQTRTHTHTRRMHTYERQSSLVALTVACLERGQHVYMKYIEKKIENNFSLIAYKLMHKN